MRSLARIIPSKFEETIYLWTIRDSTYLFFSRITFLFQDDFLKCVRTPCTDQTLKIVEMTPTALIRIRTTMTTMTTTPPLPVLTLTNVQNAMHTYSTTPALLCTTKYSSTTLYTTQDPNSFPLCHMWTLQEKANVSVCSSAWMKNRGNAEVCNEYIMIDSNMSDPQILHIARNT